ncbi:hypothetical protein NLG97_g8819 [Lecanicillium saksenae]|uniref:Uncharacterized protein n=1 Tax=Lecanicillium saksenae TaxID=468837 RepID=A0ACC1QKT5_9HYPO|nr:hypothetical protein NLG97_g8819 [Lecanicillium saksenae]
METDRAQRLNERLRGAGRANVGSDDFDLNLDLDVNVEETGNRADRLNERLRGAGRANVGSAAFELDIDGIEAPFRPAGSSSPPARPDPGARYSPDIASEPEGPNQPIISPDPGRAALLSPQRPRVLDEEITESPIHAPGSGHRRRVPVQEAKNAANRISDLLGEDTHQHGEPEAQPTSRVTSPMMPRLTSRCHHRESLNQHRNRPQAELRFLNLHPPRMLKHEKFPTGKLRL